MKLQQGEQLIKQHDNAVWVRGTFSSVVGKLVLTNRRLAFEQRSVIRSALLDQFGIVGNVSDEVLPRNVVVNVPLGQLAAFSPIRVFSSRKVLPITTKTGAEYLFSGPKFEQWAPLLRQVGLYEAAQPWSIANPLSYGQLVMHSQQPTYAPGHAPPHPQAPSKRRIPWWGWVLIAGGIVLLACAACSIAILALRSGASGITPSSMAAALKYASQGTSAIAIPF